jgi:bleomycin hydrolase
MNRPASLLLAAFSLLLSPRLLAQSPELGLRPEYQVAATPVKNQGATGTCWCFSMVGVVESECLRTNRGEFDLSEAYLVRHTYLDKARNYVRRQGFARFDEGGLGHDMLRAIKQYGAVPESAYPGLKPGQTRHDHSRLVKDLRGYLDGVLKQSPVPEGWEMGFIRLLDDALGVPPRQVEHAGRTYTPRQFAEEVLGFRADAYVHLTSFTHHPFDEPFILEVPDNFANGAFYNIPLDTLLSATRGALAAGYPVLWDADVSNPGWNQRRGYAQELQQKTDAAQPDAPEKTVDQALRQRLFDAQITTDDHLMQITGTALSPAGKRYFVVKNSWGESAGPFRGYIHVSEPYFALNTISLVIPKAALSEGLRQQLGL